MKIRSIKYYIKEGFRSLIKNRLMSVASIMTVAVCILTVSLSYCISENLDYMLKQFENSIGITAFAKEDIEEEKIDEILKQIQNIPHVKSVEYLSPEDGLESMKEEFGDDQGILDGYIDDNPLSAAFNVTVDEAQYQKNVKDSLSNLDGIRKVNHALSVTNSLINISKIIHVISIVIIILLCIVSIVIIVNTIKLAVYIRRTEINIMKYVGATDWFIRWPFIIEGTLIGIIGAAIPIVICVLGYNPAIEKLASIPIINQLVDFKPGMEIFYKMMPVSFIVGIVIGTFGSVFSVRKHLQV